MNPTAARLRTLQRLGSVTAVLLCVAATLTGTLPDGQRGVTYIVVHLSLMAVACVVAWAAHTAGSAEWRWLVGAGLAARLVLVPAANYTTHDVQRYLWDGRVLLEGIDPYQTPPSDPAVAHLRQPESHGAPGASSEAQGHVANAVEQWPTPAEHANYTTLYPPGALLLFAACSSAGSNVAPWLWKWMVTLASLLLMALMVGRPGDKLPPARIAWATLHPLLLLEGGIGSHVDMFAALGLVAALVWAERRPAWAGMVLAVGVLCKPSPLVVVLPVAVWLGWKRGREFVASTVLALACAYGAFLLWGLRPFGSTGTFFGTWRFGSPLGSVLSALLPGKVAFFGAAAAGILGILALSIWVAGGAKRISHGGERGGGRSGIFGAALMACTLLMCLSPVVFPWYLLPLVSVWVMAPNFLGLFWAATLPLTYEVIDVFDLSEAWHPATWPLVIVGLGWIAGVWLDCRLGAGECASGASGMGGTTSPQNRGL